MGKSRLLVPVLVCIMLAFSVLVSCQSASENYIRGFERFVSKVEKENANYTDEDWERKDLEFEKYTNEKYEKVEKKLTSNDRKKIGELTARYYKVRAMAYGNSLIDGVEEGIDYLDGFLNGLLKTNDNNEEKDK